MQVWRELLWGGAAVATAALLLSGFHGCSPAAWWAERDEPDPYTVVRGSTVVVLLPTALLLLRYAWMLPPRLPARHRRAFAAAALLFAGVATALLVMMLRVVTPWDHDPDGGVCEYLRMRWLVLLAIALFALEGLLAAARALWPGRRAP